MFFSDSVSLCFSEHSAVKAYNLMLGVNEEKVTVDVRDCVGELINIITGYAKKDFAKIDIDFHISIPTVIVGKNHTINLQSGMLVIVVPYGLEGDFKFTLEASMIVKSK